MLTGLQAGVLQTFMRLGMFNTRSATAKHATELLQNRLDADVETALHWWTLT